MRLYRFLRCWVGPIATAVAFLSVSTPALASGTSITLHGPHTNLYNTSFQYTAAGVASGASNYVYGWEVPYSKSCATTYKSEAKRGSLFLFVSQPIAKRKHFSIIIHFHANNTEQHRFCAYVVNKSSGKTFAHAETTWKNYAAGSAPGAPAAGTLQPAPVGEGQCQAKRFPDESAYAQIAIGGGAECSAAESVGYGADGAQGAAYSRAGFSCKGTAEAAGSTWASAWTGTYYVYSCANGAEQVAFNWGLHYAYVPASTLPTITPGG